MPLSVPMTNGVPSAVTAIADPRPPPGYCSQVPPSLNQMLDITTTREAITRAHPPAVIYLVLALHALVCAPEPPEQPVLVLDFLATFADEAVPVGERMRLFGACLEGLRRMATRQPVLVWAAQHTGLGDMWGPLLARLQAAADVNWTWSAPPPGVRQLELF